MDEELHRFERMVFDNMFTAKSCEALTSLGRSSRVMIIAKSFLAEAAEHPGRRWKN